MDPVLCAPTHDLTCFGCCPPIRPPHYDPVEYVGSLRREFIENRRQYLSKGPCHKPIVGYSCWALGFLDSSGHRVGCLLHPSQNHGEDLRFLIDYGNKCTREFCLPARVFADLPCEGQRFWTAICHGMNAFEYSSPKANPLFRIMLWGKTVLEILRVKAEMRHWDATILLRNKSFLLSSQCNPKTDRYPYRLFLQHHTREAPQGTKMPGEEDLFREFRRCLAPLTLDPNSDVSDATGVCTHSLPMEDDFLDLLRLGLCRTSISLRNAMEIKTTIDLIFKEIINST